MDRSLQQRLLGAAILLAFLVVVVPELLDGAGHRTRYPSSIDMPEAPEFKPLPAVTPLPIEQPEIENRPIPEPVVDTAGIPAPAGIVAEPVAEAPAAEADTKPVESKPKSRSDTAPKPAWALQIASLGDKNNALKMRDRFRARGFSAHVVEDKGLYKVRIGPELDRQRMEKLQARIQKEDNIKGMIVSHP